MSKFEEIANKAKEKVNEAVDVAKNYDYKAKAEELKEKASDIADKAKEYDYKEKAKEIADTVKNYDYKNESENIKKGGIKYFWKKHKKLAIISMVILLILFIVPKFTGNEITDTNNGYRCFLMTKTEFVEKYNDAYYEVTGSDLYNPSKYPRLDEARCQTYSPNSRDVEVYPNIKVLYEYDTTLYSGYGQSKNSVLDISTDENGNIVTIVVTRGSSALGTNEAMKSFFNVDCATVLSSLTGKSNSEAVKLVNKVASDAIVEKEDNYEYMCYESDGKTSFVIKVSN